MKVLTNIIRVIVGALFIFSGFVKAVDPLGTGYKMQEYFESFASVGWKPFWDWMSNFSTPFAVVMVVIEMLSGLALLTGWRPKFTVWVLFLMTLFFTLLTGYTYLSGYCPTTAFGFISFGLVVLIIITASEWNSSRRNLFAFISFSAITIYLILLKFTFILFTTICIESKMKVTDCGCFGDFLKISPQDTFIKDIVLDVLIFILVINARYIKSIFKTRLNNAVIFVALVTSFVFCFSNFIWGLPVFDFRPYKIGNNIRELRQTKRAPVSEFVFIYKNKKTGELKEFKTSELSNINSDEWDFADRKETVIDPGIPAVINGFTVYDDSGKDITDSLLSDPNYSLMVVVYKLGTTDAGAFTDKLNPLAEECEKAHINFYCLTSADIPVDPFRHEHQTAYPFYNVDETPLKTIIRSNPGLVLLKNGVIINMWHKKHIPTFEELNKKYFQK